MRFAFRCRPAYPSPDKILLPVNRSVPSPSGVLAGVPMLELGRQYDSIREEILAAVERVCSSQHFILGEEVETFEREVSAFLGVDHAVGCASGTDALWLAIAGSGIKPGHTVITTPFSFFASASAIVRAGARPVFIDINPHTLNLDPVKVEAFLRAGKPTTLRALLPVHLYGQCADMEAFARLAGEFGINVLEDAAQAIGARWRDSPAGTMGKAAAFSFYPSKNLSAFGDAGVVVSNDADTAEHMRRLRNHGSPRRYLHEEMGWNCRLDAIQAAILRVKLPHVETWNRRRAEHAATYDRLLTQAGLFTPTADSPVRPIALAPHAHHVYHQYVIRAQRRDGLRDFLAGKKIGSEIYYPIPLHLQPVFNYLGYSKGDLPEAERAAQEVLALPMFPELRQEEQQWVVENIAEFYS